MSRHHTVNDGLRPAASRQASVAFCEGTLGMREIALWCLVYAMVLAFLLYHSRGPRLSDDSYQYLSEAENIDNGYGFKTSVVHFDTERLSGKLPAPLTTFPPGYPLVTAAVAKTGLARETAGWILSAASFIFLVPLINWAAGLLELSAAPTRIALLMLIGNSVASLQAISVATDSLFTVLSLGALVFLLRYERSKRSAVSAALAGSVLIACAFWVRYAGLFLFAAAGVYLLWRAIARRDRRSVTAAACLAVPAGLVSWLLVRNITLTGTWKGGNTKVVSHALASVLKQFGSSTFHLFFGDMPSRLGPIEVTFGVCVIILLATVARAAGSSMIGSAIGTLFSRAGLLLVYVTVYCASMVYASMFGGISCQPRYFFPLLPVYLLLFGLIMTRLQPLPSARSFRLVSTTCIVLIMGCYWATNLQATVAERPGSPHQAVAARFAMPDEMGAGLLSWFEDNVARDAVLVATDGQATQHVLKRKTISLVSSQYSDQYWDETAVRTLMQRYRADYLILYPGIDPAIEPVQQESAFLKALVEGRRPDWLELAAANSKVMIFRRASTGEPSRTRKMIKLPAAVRANARGGQAGSHLPPSD